MPEQVKETIETVVDKLCMSYCSFSTFMMDTSRPLIIFDDDSFWDIKAVCDACTKDVEYLEQMNRNPDTAYTRALFFAIARRETMRHPYPVEPFAEVVVTRDEVQIRRGIWDVARGSRYSTWSDSTTITRGDKRCRHLTEVIALCRAADSTRSIGDDLELVKGTCTFTPYIK